MCQLKADCPDGNRCEADTSQARTLRRKANALRNKHKDSVIPPARIPSPKPKPIPNYKQWKAKRLIAEINQLVPDIESDVLDFETKNLISAKIVKLGDTIKTLAETRSQYPAPTQKDFDAAYPTELALTHAQRKLKIHTDLKNKSSEVLEKYGYSLDPDTLQKLLDTSSFPHFHRISVQQYFLAIDKLAEAEKSLVKIAKMENIVRSADGELHYLKSRKLLFHDRKVAIINTLKDLGVEFSEGNLIYSQSIKRDDYLAAQNVIGAAMLYPKKWVENSDAKQLRDNRPLHPMATGSTSNPEDRPYYWAEGATVHYKKIHDTEDVEKAHDWKADPLTKEGNENMKPIGLPLNGKVTYRKDAYEYIRPFENKDGEVVNPRPAGGGWTQINLYEDDDSSKGIVTYWRRPSLVDTKETEETIRAQIVTQPHFDAETNPTRGESIAAHELFHRLTDANHTLRQMPMAFLHTRAMLGTSEAEPYSYIYPGEKDYEDEVGYPMSFNEGYAGKEYENGDNEVGSMGIESLFFGEHGGFISGKGNKADPEYYSFMVGMLATSLR